MQKPVKTLLSYFLLCIVTGVARAADRELALATIYTYQPNTKVTDENALDKDTKELSDGANLKTSEGFLQAKNVFLEGGSTGSYAELKIPNQAFRRIKAGTKVTGTSVDGPSVTGTVLERTGLFATSVKVLYDISESQSDYVKCRAGGLTTKQIGGCFKSSGTVSIGGRTVSYSYNPDTDNNNRITLAGLSKNAKNNYKINGSYFKTFQDFVNYFGTTTFGYDVFFAALDKKSITLKNVNFDFSQWTLIDANVEVVKKAAQYFIVNMEVIAELEKAVAECSKCSGATCSAVNHLDKAVAYYTGSLEGTDGTGSGVSLLQVGDNRCGNFKTCGSSGDQTTGTSKVSLDVFSAFNSMKSNLIAKQCPAATTNKNTVISNIWTILIQGATRYAYIKVNNVAATQKEEAEGFIFATQVLPAINACNATAASTIINEMTIGKLKTTNVANVKKAFESVYTCLGITCKMVGGFYSGTGYYPGMEPCTGK